MMIWNRKSPLWKSTKIF